MIARYEQTGSVADSAARTGHTPEGTRTAKEAV